MRDVRLLCRMPTPFRVLSSPVDPNPPLLRATQPFPPGHCSSPQPQTPGQLAAL